MTLREWLDVYTHNGEAQLVCAWRKRAWRAMRPVVERFLAARARGEEASAGALIQWIDTVGREMHIDPQSKRWKQEREKLVTIAISEKQIWPQPTHDEVGACLVAIDLIELGRQLEALQLLEQQAPNRHNRPCPVCGSRPASPCIEIEAVPSARKERLVPHEARFAS